MIDTTTVDGYQYGGQQTIKPLPFEHSPQQSQLVPMHPDSKRFFALLGSLGDMHLKKAKGYGAKDDPLHNLRATEALGISAWKGALIRLNDKLTRLNNYAKNTTLPYESVEDNFLDAAAYAILALVLFEESQRKGCLL